MYIVILSTKRTRHFKTILPRLIIPYGSLWLLVLTRNRSKRFICKQRKWKALEWGGLLRLEKIIICSKVSKQQWFYFSIRRTYFIHNTLVTLQTNEKRGQKRTQRLHTYTSRYCSHGPTESVWCDTSKPKNI